MKVVALETLHADGGGRNFDFLKVTTADGIVGWSEYNEDFGGRGVTAVIESLADLIVGQDPIASEVILLRLRAARRPAGGGIVAQAIGAVDNALLDIRGKALGQPVCALFGGPVRTRIRLYWSHCGMYRVRWSEQMQLPPIRNLDDLTAMASEVFSAGYGGLKANVLLFGPDGTSVHAPGFGGPGSFPELTADPHIIDTVVEQVVALRAGAGSSVAIAVDLNYNFKADGFERVAQVLADHDLAWIEVDGLHPADLRRLRDRVAMPVASLETVLGVRDYAPYLAERSVDMVIVDVPMNGLRESLRIADLSAAYDLNVAPHNFYGPLADLMSAHFCATVPNLAVMEIDGDTTPWHQDFVTVERPVHSGWFELPRGPGWGADVDEAAVRRHPAR